MNFLFDQTAIVKRYRPVVGTNKQSLSATATAEANIQKLNAETVQKIQGVFGEEFVMFIDPQLDIRTGDVVVNKDSGESFKVRQVLKAEMFGIEHLKEVYITKLNE